MVTVPINTELETRRLMFFLLYLIVFQQCSRPFGHAVEFVGFISVGGEGGVAGDDLAGSMEKWYRVAMAEKIILRR